MSLKIGGLPIALERDGREDIDLFERAAHGILRRWVWPNCSKIAAVRATDAILSLSTSSSRTGRLWWALTHKSLKVRNAEQLWQSTEMIKAAT